MGDFRSLEHPDITSMVRTGYPSGCVEENQDCTEYRRAFAEEHFSDFLAFALDGDPELLDNFVEHYGWMYKSWLN